MWINSYIVQLRIRYSNMTAYNNDSNNINNNISMIIIIMIIIIIMDLYLYSRL